MSKFIIGVDVGATKIQVGLLDQKYRILKSGKFPTETKKGKVTVVNNIINAIACFFTPSVKAIGLGIIGQVDWKKGISVAADKLPRNWRHVPLAKIIQENFKVPVFIDNDAKVFTLYEAALGQGKNYNYVVGLTLGTGIGGGLAINKNIYHGKDNAVTEFGHTVIDASSSVRCACGQIGHFEALVSGTAMQYWYQKFTGTKKNNDEIEKLAIDGHKMAQKVIKTMSYYLTIGLANIINNLNPDIMVIGGGLSRLKNLVYPAINSVNKFLIFPGHKNTKIVRSQKEDMALLIGAALITNVKYR